MHLLVYLLIYVLSAVAQAADVSQSGVYKSEPRFYRAARRDVEEPEDAPLPIPTPAELNYEFSKTTFAMLDAQETLERVGTFVERAPTLCADLRDVWHDRLSEQEYEQMLSELADLKALLAVRHETLTLELQARHITAPEEGLGPQKRQDLLQAYLWTRRELASLQTDTMDEIRDQVQKIYELRSRLHDGGYTEDNKPEPLNAGVSPPSPNPRRSGRTVSELVM